MLQWLPSIAYSIPHESEGYFFPRTATLQWCEEDYYATLYCAEIINTLTNLLFIYLAVKGIISCLKYGHDDIFLITFLGYALVGTGSLLFHTTLKYPMQLIDELSMIYTTCLMCYATFSYSKSRQFALLLAIGLVSLALFITLYYHYLQDPAFHQNAYAILTAVVLFRSMYVMEFSLRPSLRKKEEAIELQKRQSMTVDERETSRLEDRRDEKTLSAMWWMIGSGLSIFLGGFGIWHLDNEYCSTIRGWRREIGLPWGILLEGHGWWHIMTGIGAYFYITWGIWLRHCLNGRQEEYALVWPHLISLPEIVKAPDADGVSKKTGQKKTA